MGKINTGGSGSTSLIKGNQTNGTQITLVDNKGVNSRVNSGEYIFMNQPSELILDSPVSNTYDETLLPFTQISTIQPSSREEGGKKSVLLSNGWIVCAFLDSVANHFIRFMVSKDGGASFSQLCWHETGIASLEFAIDALRTNIYLFTNRRGNGNVQFGQFDATVVANINVSTTIVQATDTNLKDATLAVNRTGTKIFMCWSAQYAPYASCFNIRGVEGTIDSAGVVTLGAVQNLTVWNTAGQGYNAPSCGFNKNDNPFFAARFYNGTQYYLHYYAKDMTNWGVSSNIRPGSTYNVEEPDVSVAPNGDMHVAFTARDATYPSVDNISHSISTDNGTTWSAPTRLTNSNTLASSYPACVTDKDSNAFVTWTGWISASADIWIAKKPLGSAFSASYRISADVSPARYYPTPVDNFKNFEQPIIAFNDGTGFKFYGKWTILNSPQLIPSVTTATSATQLQALGLGTLKSYNTTPKKYSGFKSPTNLNFTPL